MVKGLVENGFADILSIEEDQTLGLITRVAGRPPIKGSVPQAVELAQLDGAKSVSSFAIYLAKNTPLIPFLLVFKGRRKKVISYFVNAIRKNLFPIFERTTIKHLSRFPRELARVLNLKNPCLCDCHSPYCIWTGNHQNCNYDYEGEKEYELILKFSLVLFLDRDDAYRYRVQDMLGSINRESLLSSPRKELRRVLDIAMSRELDYGPNQRFMFPKYKVLKMLITFMPKSLLEIIKNAIINLDMTKVILDEDDLSWAQYKHYNFRGRPYASLVRDGYGFIIDLDGSGTYIPKDDLIYSQSAINPNG